MEEPLIKKRKIAFVEIKDHESLNRIKEYLNKKTGMIAVDVESQKRFIRVKYDLRRINLEIIEKSIEELGFSLSQKITEKFKRGMAKFTEQNELDNLTAVPSSCCEDPKEISHKANR